MHLWMMARIQLCWHLKLSPAFNVDVFGPEEKLNIRISATYVVNVSIFSPPRAVLENLERCMCIFGLGGKCLNSASVIVCCAQEHSAHSGNLNQISLVKPQAVSPLV